MSSCLGLYIEDNIIKYAKVTKDREMIKVEAFGLKFYERLEEALEQIISETFSYNIPISVNLSDETYNYFYMFSLLNKNDLKKAIDTEFDSLCYEKKLNKNAFEARYAISNEANEKDKLKIIHVSSNKSSISKITQTMKEYKLSTISPIGTSISNIVSIKPKENFLIVNMEDITTITTVIDQKIYNVEKIESGAKDVLDKIVGKENSYSKAFEICKNSTIYTMEGQELQDDSNEYLEFIMPTLYKIVTRLQEYVANSSINFEKIYITGTLSAINNIDLYFQEFFKNEKCEVLKPYFLAENIKVNIKDYIEVNSAISIALQGLGYGIKSMNFKKQSLSDQLPDWMKIDVSLGKKTTDKNNKITFDMSGKLEQSEKWLLRSSCGVLMIIILYSAFSIFTNNQINKKLVEVQEVDNYTDVQIKLADEDKSKVDTKASEYSRMTQNLRDLKNKINSDLTLKNSIPNLLVQISNVIPENVQITEITNTSDNDGRHVVIKAQSKYYDELGYFKAKLKKDRILDKVNSTQGEKQGEFVKIVIEGDLP